MILSRLIWVALVSTILYAAFTQPADSHYQPGTHNAVHAIQLTWCGKSNRHCWQGDQAISVAKCESGSWWDIGHPTQARNGQYRGMFQMGSSERRLYGNGPDPWSQARAAHYYYVLTGRTWGPWACKP